MAHRYCDSCGKWLATHEYTVDDTGETVCPEHEHAVVGFIPPSRNVRERDCRFPHEESRKQARKQGLVDEW